MSSNTAAATLAEIVSKIASQGKNPDVSFLKDNPEAQTMLLMALLSSTANMNNKNNSNTNNSNNRSVTPIAAPPISQDNDKRKFDSFNSLSNTPSPARGNYLNHH